MSCARIALSILGAALVASGVVGASAASASFPGRDGRIAFASQSGAQSFLTMTPAGRALTALATCADTSDSPCGGADPAWSPDGRHIAFRRDEGLWVMKADGTGARPLAVSGSEPSWAPDGKRLVFTSLGYKGQRGLAIVRADGSSGRTLTTVSRDGAPTWSPDGRLIAFTRFRFEASGGQDIYTIAPSGRGRGRLIGGCFCNDPDWSPDGRFITYDANDAESSAQVWVATAQGKKRRRLTRRIGAEPAWSPSGRYIAFARGDDLYVMTRDGSNQRRLPYNRAKAPPADRQARYEHPSWQPLPR